MKKLNNNKFRGNTIYSLNYKFDSVSSAGKLSGTALDLIKKYNELAKEAHNNGDYVLMEVFRQYAEHYRKIVTEINERKNQNKDNTSEQNNNSTASDTPEETAALPAVENEEKTSPEENGLVETEAADPAEQAEVKADVRMRRKRSFTVIDVAAKENAAVAETSETNSETVTKTRRRTTIRRRSAEAINTEQSE